jgi:hypothetical protein
MKIKALSLVAGIAGSLVMAAPSNAAFDEVIAVDETAIQNAALPGSVAAGRTLWRIYATFTSPLDVVTNIGHANWTFTSGLYQDAFGGDGPPNPALFVPFPTVAGDSYVTIDALTQPSDTGFDPDWSAPGGGFTTPNSVIGGWFDSNPATPAAAGADGRVLIAQLNLAAGATGGGPLEVFWLADGQGNAILGTANLVIPAPGTLALLGLAGLAGRRRRS